MGRLDPAGPRRAHIVPATTVLTRATCATITAAGHAYPLYTLHMEPAPSNEADGAHSRFGEESRNNADALWVRALGF